MLIQQKIYNYNEIRIHIVVSKSIVIKRYYFKVTLYYKDYLQIEYRNFSHSAWLMAYRNGIPENLSKSQYQNLSYREAKLIVTEYLLNEIG